MTRSTPSVRPSWDTYFLTLVDAAAQRASCDRGRSGAVFVRDNDVLATGYVGAPPGLPDCLEAGHLWQEIIIPGEGNSYLANAQSRKHCVRTIHAEQNGIIRAARNGVSLKESTVYCTMEPCANCAMSLIGLGITRVVARNAYHAAHRTREMFTNVGIKLEVLSNELRYEPSLHSSGRPVGTRCTSTTLCSEFAATSYSHTEICCTVGEDT